MRLKPLTPWDGEEWSTFLGTSQPTSGRIPVVGRLPGSNAHFCLRMIATDGDDEGPILGSGTAGNEKPCS